MDYLCYKVEGAQFDNSTPLRRAFRAHLIKIAAALKAIEWRDSGDSGIYEENAAISACLTHSQQLEQAIADAKDAVAYLSGLISKAAK